MSGAGVAAAREILLKCGQTHIIEKVDQGGNWSTLAKQVLKLNDNYPEGIKVGVSYIIIAFPSILRLSIITLKPFTSISCLLSH